MSDQQVTDLDTAVAPIGRGAGWLIDGFGYFMQAPLAWIGAFILLIIISIVLSLVPIIGSLASQVLMPVFFGGLMLGCHAQSQGGGFTVNHLFAGFSQRTAQLIVLGILYIIGLVVITAVLVMLILMFPNGIALLEQLENADVEGLRAAATLLLLMILLGSALYLPLIMAYWFAPALVILDGLSPVAAMKTSFKGCLYNILPFLVYGIVALVFFLISIIPFLLGLIILIPMITASIYIAYREIYHPA